MDVLILILNAMELPSILEGKYVVALLTCRFTLSGVEIRNNQGRGIWVPNGNVYDFIVNGCTVFQNGQGFLVTGISYMITGNLCDGNTQPNSFNGGGQVISNYKC